MSLISEARTATCNPQKQTSTKNMANFCICHYQVFNCLRKSTIIWRQIRFFCLWAQMYELLSCCHVSGRRKGWISRPHISPRQDGQTATPCQQRLERRINHVCFPIMLHAEYQCFNLPYLVSLGAFQWVHLMVCGIEHKGLAGTIPRHGVISTPTIPSLPHRLKLLN